MELLAFPHIFKFSFVHCRPFDDQFLCSVWKIAFYHFKSFDIEQPDIFSIYRMKMWGRVAAEEQLDDDPIKSCYFRHFLFLFLPYRRVAGEPIVGSNGRFGAKRAEANATGKPSLLTALVRHFFLLFALVMRHTLLKLF